MTEKLYSRGWGTEATYFGRYVQRYGLSEACDDIEHVLRHVALTLGRTQKVKVLTGTGECSRKEISLFWGAGARLLGIPAQLQALLTPPSTPTSPGNVNVTMLNYPSAAYEFLRDFRAGRLGKVTLD